MLQIQREISRDPFVQEELTSTFGDMLQAGGWTEEEGQGTVESVETCPLGD